MFDQEHRCEDLDAGDDCGPGAAQRRAVSGTGGKAYDQPDLSPVATTPWLVLEFGELLIGDRQIRGTR